MSAARRPTKSAKKAPAPRPAAAKKSAPRAPHAAESLLEHLRDTVQECVAGLAGVERRRLFGTDGCWTVRGSIFALVIRSGRIVVRLTEPASQEALLALPGAALWQLPNKPPMRAWLQLPESLHDDTEQLTAWLGRAFAQAPAAPSAKPSAKKGVASKSPAKGRAK